MKHNEKIHDDDETKDEGKESINLLNDFIMFYSVFNRGTLWKNNNERRVIINVWRIFRTTACLIKYRQL